MSDRFFKIFCGISVTAMVILAVLICVPLFFFTQIKTEGSSMYPTIRTGDHILISKAVLGARIFKERDYSSPKMDCFRMPGLRKLRPGDVAVFNYPYGWNNERIGFKADYIYVKRCIACPGDSLSIEDGFYRNSSCRDRIIGLESSQRLLSDTPDSILIEAEAKVRTIPYDYETGWTIKNFGPVYIPGEGDEISLDSLSAALYGRAIEYETGIRPVVLEDGRVKLGVDVIKDYAFTKNWYFFGGDNVLSSKDSRYVGLVPEDFVIGIATRVLFSRDPYTGKPVKSRRMKRISSALEEY